MLKVTIRIPRYHVRNYHFAWVQYYLSLIEYWQKLLRYVASLHHMEPGLDVLREIIELAQLQVTELYVQQLFSEDLICV